MEIILLERIEKLGQMGEIVTVKSGYARNYLLPKKKALRATDASRAQFESQRAQLEAENLQRRSEAESVATKIEELNISLIRQAGDNGQLYGSVSGRDIANSISAAGVTVARGQVLLDRPIKELGLNPIRVSLHPEVQVEVLINVARTDDEAAAQLERGLSITDIEDAAEAAELAVALAEEALAVADDKDAETEALDGLVDDEVAERIAADADGDDGSPEAVAEVPEDDAANESNNS